MRKNTEKAVGKLNETANEKKKKIHFFNLEADYFGKAKINNNVCLDWAKSISKPKVFGEFIDGEHYLQTYKLVANLSQELRHRGLFALRNVVPRLAKRSSLLDVGPGNGELTRWVGRKFNKVTIIDVNKRALKSINFGSQRNIEITRRVASIGDVKFENESFDMMMLSQVLYYVPKKMWFEIVEKAFRALVPGGICLLIISGEKNDKANLIRDFDGEPIETGLLLDQMEAKLNATIEVYDIEEKYNTTNLISMLHLAGFFLADGQAKARETELVEYLDLHQREKTKNYFLTSLQRLIVITKEF